MALEQVAAAGGAVAEPEDDVGVDARGAVGGDGETRRGLVALGEHDDVGGAAAVLDGADLHGAQPFPGERVVGSSMEVAYPGGPP